MGASQDKKEIRKMARLLRDGLNKDLRCRQSKAITRQILKSDVWGSSDLIYTYLSFGSEVDTKPLIKAALGENKHVALPCCSHDKTLTWRKITNLDHLILAAFGILEPDPAFCKEVVGVDNTHAICVVPGLLFDYDGYRLGYGAGYYDRFLAQFEGISLGVCYTQQVIPSLEDKGLVNSWDRPCDHIVYEGGYDRNLLR